MRHTVTLSEKQVEALSPIFDLPLNLTGKLRIELEVNSKNAPDLLRIASENKWRALVNIASAHLSTMAIEDLPTDKLEVLNASLTTVLHTHCKINGWLFYNNQFTDVPEPWRIESLTTHARNRRDRYDTSPDYVMLNLTRATSSGNNETSNLTFNVGCDIARVLEAKRFTFESAAAIEQYERDFAEWLEIVSRPGEQYVVQENTYQERSDNRRGRLPKKQTGYAKVVTKVHELTRSVRGVPEWLNVSAPSIIAGKAPVEEVEDGDYSKAVALQKRLYQPVRLDVQVKTLDGWNDCVVNFVHLLDYEWRSNMFEKLVLPKDQLDAIKLLTETVSNAADPEGEEADNREEDFVAGKTGGTNILLRGAPGLGKTLTAELVCEYHRIPLVKLTMSTLGYTRDFEDILKRVMGEAEDLGVAVLLDEADVYIRSRDNDLQHNALVAAMLRVLEYNSTLLFQTTNRVDDVDDAILDRMLAVIDFTYPEEDLLRHLIDVHMDQLGLIATDEQKELLLTEAGIVAGRDVRNFFRLYKRLYQRTRKTADLSKYSLDETRDMIEKVCRLRPIDPEAVRRQQLQGTDE